MNPTRDYSTPETHTSATLLSSTQTKHQVESALLLDVVVAQGAAILQLLPGKDQTLLVWWDSLLVLNLRLHIINGVGRFNLESDGLSSEGLDKNLHSSTEAEDQVESALLLDIVVAEGATVLELLPGKDQTLLVWGNALLVLNLGLDVVDGVGALNLEGDGLSGQGLDEDLHSSAETEDKVEGRLLLNIVVGESATVFKLLSSENEALLVWRDALLVLDLCLDIVDGVRGLHLKGDGLAGEGLHEDLHVEECMCLMKFDEELKEDLMMNKSSDRG